MSEKELKRTVLLFRNGLLVNRSSSQMCAVVCYALQGYLSVLGVETETREGEIEQPDYTLGHVWLAMDDGRIIDPTADQIIDPDGKRMPKVYIGQKPSWYANEKEHPQLA